MRHIYLPIAVAALAACDNTPTEYATPVVVSGINAKTEEHRNHTTQLKGDEEVPPRETGATGNAVFHISADGNSVDYKVIVANIDNVFMSHIHIGPAGSNGPIAVSLYPSTKPGPSPLAGGGPNQWVIVTGTFHRCESSGLPREHGMAPGLAPRGDPRVAGAYTNVHTTTVSLRRIRDRGISSLGRSAASSGAVRPTWGSGDLEILRSELNRQIASSPDHLFGSTST
jgi:hypothetical protein